MNDLTNEDFREWAFNPATLHFTKTLTDKRNDYTDKLGSNYYTTQESIQRTIGICQSLKATIDAIESYKEAQDDK
jgi:hypothetical protein